MTFPDTTFTTGTTITSNWLNAVNNKCLETVNVKDFGATGDGVTDDTAAIQAAIDYIKSLNGGNVYIPQGDYKITSTLLVSQHNITLVGEGQGGPQNSSAAQIVSGASRIFWNGDTTSPMVLFETPDNLNPRCAGGMSNIMLDAMNIAKFGLRLSTWRQANFENLFIYSATDTHLYLGTKPDSKIQGGTSSTVYNRFSNIVTNTKNRNPNTSKALRLGTLGYGITPEATTGNSCYNYFETCLFDSGTTTYEVLLEDTDNNCFVRCSTSTLAFGSGLQDTSGRAVVGSSRGNFVIASEIGTVYALADPSNPSKSSSRNLVIGLNFTNGSGDVVQEDGAYLIVSNTVGYGTTLNFEKGFSVNVNNSEKTELVEISTSDTNNKGAVWLKNEVTGAPNGYYRATGGRNGAAVYPYFSGRMVLDAYRVDGLVPTNRALGSVYFGASTVPNSMSRDDTVYSSAIISRAAGTINSAADCPANIEFHANNSGDKVNDVLFATPRLRVKHTGAIQFVPLASDPATAEKGDVYFNSGTNKLRFYNGSAWADV